MELEVQAYDLGQPTQFSEINAVITIEFTDVNDNIPKFTVKLHEKQIDETIDKGSFILQVTAVDADISPSYNQVFYSFSEISDNFMVSRKDGNITVARGAKLAHEDNEGKKIFVLKVEATDGNEEHNDKDICTVNVNVRDINNVPPVFLHEKFEFTNESILEEQETMWIIELVAYDPDENHKLEFAIDYDTCIREAPKPIPYYDPPDVNTYKLNDKFTVETLKDRAIVNVTKVDREILEKITLNITVTDVNADVKYPNQVATYQRKIIIIDINDNAPMFVNNDTIAGYNVSEKENVADKDLLQVRAIDIDGPGNNVVTFSLELPLIAEQIFSVNSDTGMIRIEKAVDYEEHEQMVFKLIAKDNGKPSLNSNAEVNVTIIDVNDNKPVFENVSYERSVKEDADIGYIIMTIKATDKDSGDFGLVHYDLTRGNDDNDFFNIGKESGILTVKKSLIRTDNRYELKPTVKAFDNPFSNWNDNQEEIQVLTIKILDVNKFAPVFVKRSEPFLVSELENIKVPFGRVNATDADRIDSENSKIEYFIVSQDKLDLFQVELTGEISAKKNLKTLFGIYDVTFMAKDKGKPPLNSTSVFQIQVYDENDHSPVFVEPLPGEKKIVSIPEATQSQPIIGYHVMTVRATDEDDGLNGTVTYAFLENTEEREKNASYFKIDKDTGKITIEKNVKKKEHPRFTLVITAQDKGTPPRTAEENVIIDIIIKSDEDLLPYFEKQYATVNFTEHKIGEINPIPKAKYREFLDNETTPICYFIIGGDLKLFHLNKTTGNLRVADGIELDREVHAFHVVYVLAMRQCEKDPPAHSGHMEELNKEDLINITIGVTDINDNPPIFTRRKFPGRMSTFKTKKNDLITKVEATDADEGENAKIEYAIYGKVTTEEDENLGDINLMNAFKVGKDGGEIWVSFEPKPNMKGYFKFDVIAKDIDGLNDTAEVFIYLMREDQQIMIIIERKESELTDTDKSEFTRIFEAITKHLCIADIWEPDDDHSGRVQDMTKVWMHLVNNETNKILSPSNAEKLVDDNIMELRRATRDKFPIYTIKKEDAYTGNPTTNQNLEKIMYILIAAAAFLALSLFLAIVIYIIKVSSMKRTLKAATATAFGSQDSGLNRIGVVSAPNTNQHTFEGSNPLWNQMDVKFNEAELDSETASVGSLDINMMNYPEKEGMQNPAFVDTEQELEISPSAPKIMETLPEKKDDDKTLKKKKKNKAPDVPQNDKPHFHKNTINTLRVAEKDWRRRHTQGDLKFDPNEMPFAPQPDHEQERRLSLFIRPEKSSDL